MIAIGLGMKTAPSAGQGGGGLLKALAAAGRAGVFLGKEYETDRCLEVFQNRRELFFCLCIYEFRHVLLLARNSYPHTI
jgi:hypothetical protein